MNEKISLAYLLTLKKGDDTVLFPLNLVVDKTAPADFIHYEMVKAVHRENGSGYDIIDIWLLKSVVL